MLQPARRHDRRIRDRRVVVVHRAVRRDRVRTCLVRRKCVRGGNSARRALGGGVSGGRSAPGASCDLRGRRRQQSHCAGRDGRQCRGRILERNGCCDRRHCGELLGHPVCTGSDRQLHPADADSVPSAIVSDAFVHSDAADRKPRLFPTRSGLSCLAEAMTQTTRHPVGLSQAATFDVARAVACASTDCPLASNSTPTGTSIRSTGWKIYPTLSSCI